ncbi:MAG: hypothetical protein ABIH23_27810, partial [bacterium]
LNKLRAILEGSVTIPALTLEYSYDPQVMHCHEAELCPARAYYRRTIVPPPPMSDRAVLTFMRGRLFERILADELPSVTKDGISGRVDGLWNEELIETKSTMMDMAKFNPITSQPHWLQRSKAYCTLHDKKKIMLVIWFLVGDMWTKKTINVGLKCWDLNFTEQELEHNWVVMKTQKMMLMNYVRLRVFPDSAWIRSRLRSFECSDCLFNDLCAYPLKGKKK